MIPLMQSAIEKLLDDLNHISLRYQQARKGHQFEFYEDIAPFVSQVDQDVASLNLYQNQIQNLPYFNRQKFVRMQSLISDLAVSCHQSTTSKKIFIDRFKAVQHDLNYLIQNGGHKHV